MDLSELAIEAVKRDEESELLVLMREHHYLVAPYKIGESVFYAAVLQGRWVALSSFYAFGCETGRFDSVIRCC